MPYCKKCNETLEGDGFSSVMHCPNTNEDLDYMEPDSGPVYCDFDEENVND